MWSVVIEDWDCIDAICSWYMGKVGVAFCALDLEMLLIWCGVVCGGGGGGNGVVLLGGGGLFFYALVDGRGLVVW